MWCRYNSDWRCGDVSYDLTEDGPMVDLSSLYAGLAFYRQKRADGGIRTGIMIKGDTVLGRFEDGQDDYDPSLVWSVDLRCFGSGLPESGEEGRQWLLDHESIIREGFDRYSDDLCAGSDVTGPYLLEWSRFPRPVPGVELKIACGALRRIDALSLAGILAEISLHWRDLIEGLSAEQPTFA